MNTNIYNTKCQDCGEVIELSPSERRLIDRQQRLEAHGGVSTFDQFPEVIPTNWEQARVNQILDVLIHDFIYTKDLL